MAFPYITQVKVNNCYTYQDFNIPNLELEEFKHIIITGKNGSGKTTILSRIAFLLTQLQKGVNKVQQVNNLKSWIRNSSNNGSFNAWKEELEKYNDIELQYSGGMDSYLRQSPNDYILAYFKAHRRIMLNNVESITREDQFLTNLKKQSAEDFIKQFKQYLVNKKVYEAFDYMNSKNENINQSKLFFENIKETLRTIFHDRNLTLDFVQEKFEFYLTFSDGRKVTFNQLSEGFSAFLSIIMDLLIRTDLLRKTKEDYSLEPEGIVIIDEPETHFHLQMQYEILPLISRLFPKIQLIIATHSPAIISSLKNAVIYDLSSKDEVSDWVLGSSFSELMVSHFGLDNEYSPIADKIIFDVNNAVLEKNIERLKTILSENETFLTPSLKLEIESQIIHIQSKI